MREVHKLMSGETTLTVIGNLTDVPELRYTQSGLAVANFTVASTPRHFDRTKNEWVDGSTLFQRCTLWREYAENAACSLSRGDRVIVSGTLGQETYETKPADGSAPERRTVTLLTVDDIGPALRYARATVSKITRQTPVGAPSDSFVPEGAVAGV